MSAREALIVACSKYRDAHLKQLVAPPQDAQDLARALSDPAIGGFNVETVINKSSVETKQAIESFFVKRKSDDLLLLYFSGHGLKDEPGHLYLATVDTNYELLRATSISARFINEVMRTSRSRKQVLLLDCCYSGAFMRGSMPKARVVGSAIGTEQHFSGQGRVVITASDAMQYAFEGDAVSGSYGQSVFTKGLVHGLTSGEADLDRNGLISLDELYEYVHDFVVNERPEQVPEKSVFNVRGDVFIARSPVIRPGDLPTDLQDSVDSPLPWVRAGAVGELSKLLDSSNKGIALAARNALEGLLEDDSHEVASIAAKALAPSTVAPIAQPAKLPLLLGKVPIWGWLAGLVVLLAFLLTVVVPQLGNPTPTPPSIPLHSGGFIIYEQKDKEGRPAIYLQNPTGEPVELIAGKEEPTVLDFTPHGELFAIRAKEDEDVKLFIVRADGEVVRPGVNYGWSSINSATWSPDGRGLVVDVPSSPGHGRLVFLDSEGDKGGEYEYASKEPIPEPAIMEEPPMEPTEESAP